MAYTKKVIILKQITEGYSLFNKTASGILRTETESGVTELHLSVINSATINTGVYHLFIMDDKKTLYSFDLGKRPCSFNTVFDTVPNFANGLAAGICVINSSIPITVLFGKTDEFIYSAQDFKKTVAERCALDRKEQLKKAQCLTDTSNTQFTDYNDEAVATENYYELDQDIQDKLDAIKGVSDEYIRTENGVSCDRSQEKTIKSQPSIDSFPNEEYLNECQEYSKSNPYYLSVKKELEEIFLKFPEEDCLPRYFFGSRWAKIRSLPPSETAPDPHK